MEPDSKCCLDLMEQGPGIHPHQKEVAFEIKQNMFIGMHTALYQQIE